MGWNRGVSCRLIYFSRLRFLWFHVLIPFQAVGTDTIEMVFGFPGAEDIGRGGVLEVCSAACDRVDDPAFLVCRADEMARALVFLIAERAPAEPPANH